MKNSGNVATGSMLTQPRGDLDRKMLTSKPGQAHFAGTGPDGKYCYQCTHYTGHARANGYCRKFAEMMSKHDVAFTRWAHACRYFEPRR